MLRPLRLSALIGIFLCRGMMLWAQGTPPAEQPLPENYFPVLREALASAARQSPRMIARNADDAMAEANRIDKHAGELPTVGGFANYFPYTLDKRGDLPSTTVTQKFSYYFSLNQPVYHWGALRNNTRIGELQLKIAQGQTAEAYRLLALEIRAQYLQLVTRKATLARAQTNLQRVVDELTLAQANREKGLIAASAIFFPEISLEQTRLAVDRAIEEFEAAKTGFARLCGRGPLADAEIADAIPRVPSTRDGWQQMLTDAVVDGEIGTYGMTTMRKQLEVARLEYRNAATRLRPNLNAIVGTSQDQVSYSSNIAARSEVRSFFAGASVNWSIFDGFATRAAKMTALARIRQMEQAYRDMSTETREAARSRMRQVEFSARNLELVEKILSSNTGAFNARKDDVTRGLASAADLRASEYAYAGMLIDTYNARADYLMKVADFLSFVLKDPALANLPPSSP